MSGLLTNLLAWQMQKVDRVLVASRFLVFFFCKETFNELMPTVNKMMAAVDGGWILLLLLSLLSLMSNFCNILGNSMKWWNNNKRLLVRRRSVFQYYSTPSLVSIDNPAITGYLLVCNLANWMVDLLWGGFWARELMRSFDLQIYSWGTAFEIMKCNANCIINCHHERFFDISGCRYFVEL